LKFYIIEQQKQMEGDDFIKHTKQAEEGDMDSQFYMADCYDSGKEVNKDHKMAIYWYEKAANQGHIAAQFLLGLKHLVRAQNPLNNRENEEGQAIYWFEKTEKQGHECSKNYLDMFSKDHFQR